MKKLNAISILAGLLVWTAFERSGHTEELGIDGAPIETTFRRCLSLDCSLDIVRRFKLGEPVLGDLIREEPLYLDGKSDRALLFPPSDILFVRTPNSAELLVEGLDYQITPDELRFLPSPRLNVAPSDFHKAKAPDTSNAHISTAYQNYQYWVTYRRNVKGLNGEFEKELFVDDKLCADDELKELRKSSEVRVTIFGDSISLGANASSQYVYPYQPGYAGLVEAYLSSKYPKKWYFRNTSVGGWSTANAIAALNYRVLDSEANLHIIAFGMNDAGFSTFQDFEMRLKVIVDRIHGKYPNSHIILVSSHRANPLWDKVYHDRFEQFASTIKRIAVNSPKISCADMDAAWVRLMERKKYLDLTGNGANHPNDFGHRIQAEVVLRAILGEEYTALEN